jgi:hypothetical protein
MSKNEKRKKKKEQKERKKIRKKKENRKTKERKLEKETINQSGYLEEIRKAARCKCSVQSAPSKYSV